MFPSGCVVEGSVPEFAKGHLGEDEMKYAVGDFVPLVWKTQQNCKKNAGRIAGSLWEEQEVLVAWTVGLCRMRWKD
jgi:hypothetical protein